MPVPLSFSGTYPEDENFWVPTADEREYPKRYGDVFATPQDSEDNVLPACTDSKQKPWRAVMALNPSCELGAKGAPSGVQVVRVHRLREVSVPQRDEIRTGFAEQDGVFRVMRANLVYLAPMPGSTNLNEELFADLRVTARVPLETLRREAAMSHDARVAVIRRDIYFRYRWYLPLDDVAELERARISSDRAFVGPRPPWAP